MKITVFGGAGFLGSHAADSLTETGHEVTVFDIVSSPYLQPAQNQVLGDILDKEAVGSAVAGSDVVVNFAGLADLDEGRDNPEKSIMLNVLGNTNIMRACVDHGVKRYIYASTIYVYSQKGGFYRCSKQAAEVYIEEFNRRFGLEYTILRYGTLYGPRSGPRNSIYRYLREALETGRIVTKGSGRERREYIHVKDASRLLLETLSPEYANKHVTITGHQALYFRDLLESIQEIMGGRVELEFTGETNGSHYSHTPYSYLPKAGLKLTLNPYTDMGQGLLECLADIEDDAGKTGNNVKVIKRDGGGNDEL